MCIPAGRDEEGQIIGSCNLKGALFLNFLVVIVAAVVDVVKARGAKENVLREHRTKNEPNKRTMVVLLCVNMLVEKVWVIKGSRRREQQRGYKGCPTLRMG